MSTPKIRRRTFVKNVGTFLYFCISHLLRHFHESRWILLGTVLLHCIPSARPVCTLSTGQNAVYWWISEDKQAGTVVDVLPVEGRANDSGGQLKNIELRLVAGFTYFALNPSNKELKLIKTVDREAGETKLDAVVECRSLVPNDNFRVNITIQVKVQDVNDNAPIFEHSDYFMNITEVLSNVHLKKSVDVSASFKTEHVEWHLFFKCLCEFTVLQELPVGTLVYSGLKATDFDSIGPNSQVLYSIDIEGAASSLLSIPNPWDGNIVINKRIDFEELNNFTVTVTAKDSGNPPLSSKAKIHITVQDIDDQNPKFKHEHYSATLNSDAPLGVTLDVFPEPIEAVDMDTLNAPIYYSLSGVDAEMFEVEKNAGTILLRQPVRGGQNYLLTVHAAQVDRPERQAATALMVRITGNGNGGKPQFTSQSYVVQVLESVPVNSQLLRLSAVDPGENTVLLYNLKDTAKQSQFKLDRDTGVLKLASPLDYETKQNHTLAVAVTDGKQSSEATIHVIVEDVNDNSPEFEYKDYYFKAASNRKGTLLGVVKAVDGDKLDRVTYNLLNFNDLFDVDDFGAIRIRNETKVTNRSYELVIAATDSGIPPRMGHATIRVDFGDISYSSVPIAFSAATGSTEGSLILIISLASVLSVLAIGCFCLLLYVFKIRKRKSQRKPQMQPTSRNQIIMANPESAMPKANGSLRSRYAEKLISPMISPSSIFLSETGSNSDNRLNESQSPQFRDNKIDGASRTNSEKRLSTFIGSGSNRFDNQALSIADYCAPQGFMKHNHISLNDRESIALSQDDDNTTNDINRVSTPNTFSAQPPGLTVYF